VGAGGRVAEAEPEGRGMSQAQARNRGAVSAAVAHDVALLVAVFYAPIFWGGFNTSGQALVSGVVGVAVVAALVGRWLQGYGPGQVPNAVHLPALAFLGISVLSAFFSVSWHASLLEVSRLGVGALVFWLVGSRALLPATPPRLVAAAFACSVVLVVFIPVSGEEGLALRMFAVIGVGVTCAVIVTDRGRPDPVRWLWAALVVSAAFVVALYGIREKVTVWREMDNPTWQIFSTFFNPNPLAGFFAMVFPLALSAALAAAVAWRRMLWGFCGVVLVGAMIPTYSKGGWLALAGAVCCYGVVLGWPKVRVRRALVVAAGAAALAVAAIGLSAVVSQPVRARAASVLSEQSASNMFRILTWKGTIDLAADNTWLGVGPGGFKFIYPKYATAGYVEAAHQNYLQVFAEQGVFGGAIFLWLIGAVVFTGRRALAAGGDLRRRALAVGGLCSIVALLVHSFLDYDWYIGAIGISFWLVAGMLAHEAHGRPVAEVTVAEGRPEDNRRGRGRRRPARREEGAEGEVGVRQLPWPRGGAERGVAIVVVALVLFVCVWELASTALAQQAVVRGDALVMSQRPQSALEMYREATQYDPGLADAWERYGLLRAVWGHSADMPEEMRREWIEEGVEAIERAMALERTNFRRPAALGRLYGEIGQTDKAVRYYREALERFPKHTKTMRLLAAVYQDVGEEERAVEIYREMEEIEGGAFSKYRALATVDVDTEYAYAHYELGRFALKEYESGKRGDRLEYALSQFGEALRVIEDYFVRAEPTDRMFLMLRRPREYRGEYMRELEAKTRWRMADAYEEMGDSARAEEEREGARARWEQVGDTIAASTPQAPPGPSAPARWEQVGDAIAAEDGG